MQSIVLFFFFYLYVQLSNYDIFFFGFARIQESGSSRE
jgi:hypothetical protein